MDIWSWLQIVLICLGCVLVIFILFTSCVCAMLNGIIFSRQDKNPQFKYFTPEYFNLTVEHMPVRLYGVELAANLYTDRPLENCDRVVIFQHGFGAGSSSYMTEIAHFAKQGFAVVAADAYGCNNSAGKKVYGFYAGAQAVIAAYSGVKSDERLKDKPVILVGHSWGAYSVLAACATIKPQGVVALSGFNAPAQCLCDQIKVSGGSFGRFYAPLLHGWFYLGNIFRFGAKGNTKANKAIKKSGVKTLLIQGEKDATVAYKHSAVKLVEGENVTKLILPDKKHNPYNTVEAEKKLAELTGGHDFANGQEAEEYFKNFDWSAATEEDEAVMSKIDGFIKGV
ncbi:MAG: alpha/beta fold hydrolase [Roseburia sp.]|nr:alpha/beta fold hydrolase [Roseburia sp.]